VCEEGVVREFLKLGMEDFRTFILEDADEEVILVVVVVGVWRTCASWKTISWK
jgi:hypothetical protein